VDDPFKPPKANLEVPRELAPAPQAVRVAFALLCTSASVGVLVVIATWFGFIPSQAGANQVVAALSSLIGIGVIVLFAWKIRTGRNWARWVFAVWTLVGTIGFVASALLMPQVWKAVSGLLAFIAVGQSAMQIAAIVFTFTPRANAWFREASGG
jgi:hypothetical protein